MTFLYNAWYVAAWDHELKNDSMLSRRLLDKKIVMYRDENGDPVALQDRCPHRFAPLSLGCLRDGEIECGYHGLRFNAKGQYVGNPHGNGHIPKGASVRKYSLVERYSALWIWMGNNEPISDAIPDFSFLDPKTSIVAKDYLHARANYVLETDNIMDLSHIEFMHKSTLGSSAVRNAVSEVSQEGNTVWSRRLTKDEVLPDFLEEAWRIPKGTPVSRWMDVRWDAPANMLLSVGAVPSGDAPRTGNSTYIAHFFTPETETATHYWFGFGFPKSMGDAGYERANTAIANIRKPFELEDLPMLEAQQENMEDQSFWELKPVLLAGDAGAIRARRVLEALIKDEASDSA